MLPEAQGGHVAQSKWPGVRIPTVSLLSLYFSYYTQCLPFPLSPHTSSKSPGSGRNSSEMSLDLPLLLWSWFASGLLSISPLPEFGSSPSEGLSVVSLITFNAVSTTTTQVITKTQSPAQRRLCSPRDCLTDHHLRPSRLHLTPVFPLQGRGHMQISSSLQSLSLDFIHIMVFLLQIFSYKPLHLEIEAVPFQFIPP